MDLSFSDAAPPDVALPKISKPTVPLWAAIRSWSNLQRFNVPHLHQQYADTSRMKWYNTDGASYNKDLLTHKDPHRDRLRDQIAEWRNSNRTPETSRRDIPCYNSSPNYGHWHVVVHILRFTNSRAQTTLELYCCFLHVYNSYFGSPLRPLIPSHTQHTLQHFHAK